MLKQTIKQILAGKPKEASKLISSISVKKEKASIFGLIRAYFRERRTLKEIRKFERAKH